MRSCFRFVAVFASAMVLASSSFAQDDLEQFLQENVQDGRKLIGAFRLDSLPVLNVVERN